jgi:hypothetical protein
VVAPPSYSAKIAITDSGTIGDLHPGVVVLQLIEI